MSSITDNKIAPGEVTQVFVQRQDDRLHGTPTQNKKVFDEYPDLIRYKHNAALDAIDAKFAENDADIEELKEINVSDAAESARESAEIASESAQTTQDMLGRVISISNKIYTKSWDVEQEQDEFVFSAEGYTYNESDTYEVFVNGLKLSESEYTRNEDSVVLGSSISAGNTVEIIVTTNLKGKGIADTELNDDYTLTINYDDGTSMTTESIRGEKGEKGDTGDGFITPEMFGAVGDGVTDDTTAWQMAVDFGATVKATKKIYKCGQINVTKNINIDCNGADFICTGEKLFKCSGEIVKTLTGESDYTAKQVDYAISNAEYANYSGFAMLKGTNNFEKSRIYYLGGFACEFWDGKITSAYPIDVTGVSIEIINPITVHLSNIGNIAHPSISTGNYDIHILYGFGCTIDNCDMPNTNAYNVICLDKCLNCIVSNCNVKQEFQSSTNNSYLVAFSNSSFCTVRDCHMYNKYWHCITTGDTYLCYHNMVDNCKLFSDTNVACEDHENARNTIVKNCVSSSIHLAGMCVVDNCDIISNKANYKPCRLIFYAVSNRDDAVYTATNIRFYPSSGANDGYVGVFLGCSPQTTGETFYIKDVSMKNIKITSAGIGRFGFTFPQRGTTSYIVYDVRLEDSNLCPYGLNIASTYVDISNWKLYLKNFNSRILASNVFPTVYGNNYVYNDVYMDNVNLNGLIGTFANLYFNNLYSAQATSIITVSNELSGTGLHSRFTPAVLKSARYVNITDMKNGSYDYWMDIATAIDGKLYCQKYVGGQLQTVEITE